VSACAVAKYYMAHDVMILSQYVLNLLAPLDYDECCGMGVVAGWCHMSFKGPMVLNSCRTICCVVCMLVPFLNGVVILF
jgi:hypothetical protein